MRRSTSYHLTARAAGCGPRRHFAFDAPVMKNMLNSPGGDVPELRQHGVLGRLVRSSRFRQRRRRRQQIASHHRFALLPVVRRQQRRGDLVGQNSGPARQNAPSRRRGRPAYNTYCSERRLRSCSRAQLIAIFTDDAEVRITASQPAIIAPDLFYG